MANKLAVYTCVTGGYDPLLAPSVVDPRLDYFCFTNSDIPPPTPWRHVHLPPSTLNDKDQSRFAKMHPHKLPSLAGYDATLYIDGTIDIVGDVRRFIEESIRREGDIFMFDRPYWDTLLDEALGIAESGHDWSWSIGRGTRRYFRNGYKDASRLFAGGTILRRDTPRVRVLMDAWWQEYLSGSRRDQLSLGYVSQTTGVPIHSLGVADPYHTRQIFRMKRHADTPRAPRLIRQVVNLGTAMVPGYRVMFGGPVSFDRRTLLKRMLHRAGLVRPPSG